MKLTAFKFAVPKEQIALYPTKDRDGSKLMILHRYLPTRPDSHERNSR